MLLPALRGVMVRQLQLEVRGEMLVGLLVEQGLLKILAARAEMVQEQLKVGVVAVVVEPADQMVMDK